MIGLAVFLIGVLLFFLVSTVVGILVMILGIALIFIPAVPYGYSSWRGRRGPPP